MTIFNPCNFTVDEISDAVLRKLLPYINRVEDNLRSDLTILINEKVTSLRESVSEDLMEYKNQTVSDLHTSLQSNTQQLCAKMDTPDLKMASVNASMREELRAMESQLEEYKQQTTSELAGLQSNMTAGLAGLHNSLQSNSQQMTKLDVKIDTLNVKLMSVNSSVNRISDNVEAHDSHVTTELMELDQNLQQNFSLQLKKSYGYIIAPPIHTCGGTGGWRRVVYLDMTNPNTTCPSGWRLTSHSKRTCGRVRTGYYTCDSVTFPVSGGDYTRVCGRIIAYQYGATDAFHNYHYHHRTTIDSAYVCGVSLTHGSPQQHIWTFAAGYGEHLSTYAGICPCDATINITIPPFVGGDYFCESGYNSGNDKTFFPDDPLWDGDGCTASSTCCSFNNPPYFTKLLPSPTTDDIEARLCREHRTIEDTPI